MYTAVPPHLNEIAGRITDAAFHVHRALGPGLLAPVYEVCLAHELAKRGVRAECDVALPVVYDGVALDAGLRLDLLVEESIIVEVEAVDALLPIHRAQLLTYLKLSSRRLGLLINFNVPVIKNGIQRVVV